MPDTPERPKARLAGLPVLGPREGRAALRQLTRQDPVLGRLIARAGPLRLRTDLARSPFDSLLRSICYQQLHARAAERILERARLLFDGRPTPEKIRAAPMERLRGAGLSAAKAASIKDLAEKALDGGLPGLARLRGMSDEEVVSALTAIRGVGRWTAEMMLMFRLGRADVLPATDFGVRLGYSLTFRPWRLPTPAEVMRRGERWRPSRSVAAWYLWRAVDLSRGGD